MQLHVKFSTVFDRENNFREITLLRIYWKSNIHYRRENKLARALVGFMGILTSGKPGPHFEIMKHTRFVAASSSQVSRLGWCSSEKDRRVPVRKRYGENDNRKSFYACVQHRGSVKYRYVRQGTTGYPGQQVSTPNPVVELKRNLLQSAGSNSTHNNWGSVSGAIHLTFRGAKHATNSGPWDTAVRRSRRLREMVKPKRCIV